MLAQAALPTNEGGFGEPKAKEGLSEAFCFSSAI